jgi:glutamate-ammonia-ligase adenylyltransferase
VGDKFEAIRQRILIRKRDPKPLKAEILAMRNKLHAAHPNASGLFDVKHDAGGMIDIEFAVQFLILAFSAEFPSLTGNLGNIALLRIAADHGLIPAELAERCRNAYREFRRIQHGLRLNGARYARVPRERVAAESLAVRTLWQAVFGRGAGP